MQYGEEGVCETRGAREIYQGVICFRRSVSAVVSVS